jgi:hypothetical protein
MAITLLDMLQNADLITREQFEEALRNRVVYGGKIGTSLIELGFVTEEVLARFLSSKLAVPYVHPERLLAIPPETIALIPRDLALKYRAIPIYREQKRLYVVLADPADLRAIDEIAFSTGFIIKPLVTPEVRLIQALGKYYELEIDRRYQQIIERIDSKRQNGTKPPAPAREPAPVAPPAPHPPAPTSRGEEELEEAEVISEAEWVERVGRYSIDTVSKALAKADDREEIGGILMGYLAQEFDRVAMFVIRGDTAFGWKGVHWRLELKDFDRFGIPLDGPSVLRTITDGKSYYLGAVPDTPYNAMLVDALGGEPPEAALLIPLVITGRVVNILYVEGGDRELGERFGELHRLLTKAALAFETLIFRDKILMC